RDLNSEPGYLTDVGLQSTQNLGQQLRRLYVDQLRFLPQRLTNAGHFYLRCTRYPRTFLSLQQVYEGLYPSRYRDANKNIAPVEIRSPQEETLLPNEDHCPRLKYLLDHFLVLTAKKWNTSPALTNLNKRARKYLSSKTDALIDSHPSVTNLFDTITAAEATPSLRASIPADLRTSNVCYTLREIAVEQEYVAFAESAEAASLGAGPLLREMVERMVTTALTTASNGAVSQPRIALFGCHDTTIGMILVSLKIAEPSLWEWPPFTSHLSVELFRSAVTREAEGLLEYDVGSKTIDAVDYFVRIRYNSRSVVVPGCRERGAHLDGDESFCTLVSDAYEYLMQSDFGMDMGSSGTTVVFDISPNGVTNSVTI
ncbi:phosphoglycerate mutase-like protein, partial [Aulographum hederae CBS 113979]